MFIHGIEVVLNEYGEVIYGYSHTRKKRVYLYKQDKGSLNRWTKVERKPTTVRYGLKKGNYKFI